MRDRLDAVRKRLETHAAASVPHGLTDADEKTGERWDAGQIWAHLAEFITYWITEATPVRDANVHADGAVGPVPFGRVKTDPQRIAAIARTRATPPAVQMVSIDGDLDSLRTFIESIPTDRWTARGRHQTLGVMTLERIVDEFLVGHLEEHANQLDGLTASVP